MDENPRFRDKRTREFWEGERVPRFQAFERQAMYRLEILQAAVSPDSLALIPGNRFEALGGNRKGQFSIRINRQWRICFEWPEGSAKPFNIEIVDYH